MAARYHLKCADCSCAMWLDQSLAFVTAIASNLDVLSALSRLLDDPILWHVELRFSRSASIDLRWCREHRGHRLVAERVDEPDPDVLLG